MQRLTIGQVAQKTGIGIETIRFYERKGLINEPPRKESGYRQYDNDVIVRLAFIQRTKKLGFSLREIGELLSLRSRSGSTSRDIKQMAETKLADIEDRIKMLQRMKRTLKNLVDKCPGQGPTSQCPILDALDKSSL